jgi:hypothetical protein
MEDDESSLNKAFGIISDTEKFYFLECLLNGDGKASFKLSDPVTVIYKPKYMRDTVAEVLSRMGWLLEESDKPDTFVKKQRVVLQEQ